MFDVSELYHYIKGGKCLEHFKLISKLSSSCTLVKYINLINFEDQISQMASRFIVSNNYFTKTHPFYCWLSIHQFLLNAYLKHRKRINLELRNYWNLSTEIHLINIYDRINSLVKNELVISYLSVLGLLNRF